MTFFDWRFKLFLVVALAMSILLLFQLWYVVPTIREREVVAAVNSQKVMTSRIAREIDAHLADYSRRLLLAADTVFGQRLSSVDIVEACEDQLKQLPLVEGLWAVQADGRIAGASKSELLESTESFYDQQWFSDLIKQGRVVFGNLLEQEGMRPLIPLLVPAMDDNGSQIGVLLAFIRTDTLLSLTVHVLPLGYSVLLVDSNHNVLAFIDNSSLSTKTGSRNIPHKSESDIRNFLEHYADSPMHHHGEVPYVGSSTILDNADWDVVVEASKETVLAKSGSLIRQLYGINLLLFFAVSGAGIFFTSRITADRQQLATELEEAKGQLLAIFEGMEEIVYVADPENHELLYVNPYFRKVWGGAEEPVGKKCYEVIHRQQSPCSFCTNTRIFSEVTDEPYVYERRQEESGRWYRCSDKVIRWPDGRLVRLELAVDITQQKRAEEERVRYSETLKKAVAERTSELEKRTLELKAVNADLEGFSYSVSHDLRAPLRAIDGFVAILQEDYAPTFDEEGLRVLQVISDNANKMGQLIEDILACSRAGRQDISCGRVDMEFLVKEVWDSLSGERGDGDYRLEQESLPPAYGDDHALRQVWLNLLANAIKFSRQRTPAVISVSAVAEENGTRYLVRDNGVGFDPAYEEKLFLLFQRLHSEEEFEGTGVGLAVVKRFVQKHGGTITAVGKLNEGAEFSFTLPHKNEQTEVG